MKRKILVICLVLVTLCSSILGVNEIISAYEKFFYTVVIDAGHGGIDNGVIGDALGSIESQLNLKMAYTLKSVYENAGFKVVLTRTDENGLYGDTSPGFKLRDLQKRAQIVNSSNADMLISIHMNKYSQKSRRGAQVFYKANDKTSNFLAEKIQLRLNLMKESPRISNALKGDYYILNYSKIPSVIVECGFLSNADDEKLLTTNEYQQKLALEIFKGSLEYLNAKNE